MNKLFENYKHHLEERLNERALLSIGEDSIRYDFFSALMTTYNLRPFQVEVEVALDSRCFVPSGNINAKRKEKPMIDLVVKAEQINLSAEFGLFRQNSNEKGTINKTARTVKMVNDMLRTSLEAKFSSSTGLFICVADYKMIGHRLNSGFLDKFPSNYSITSEYLTYQTNQKTNKIDRRFLKVFLPLNRHIRSEILFNEQLKAKKIVNETRVIIWETKIT